MAAQDPEDVTLNTLHQDLTELKVAMLSGFRSLVSRESGEEMVRLLREGNRLQEERLTQLDARIREQHLELQQALRGIADGIRALLEGQRAMSEDIRNMSGEIRSLSADIKALIARLDALIKGRGDGSPTA